MATIRKRGPKQFQARIRIQGFQPTSKTFETRAEALGWAEQAERELRSGLGESRAAAEQTTVAAALDRYGREVTPAKKGAANERRRIRYLSTLPFAQMPLAQLRGAHLANYRDRRLADGISANTLRLEFALLSHLFEVARKDWGIETLNNPTKDFRKPKASRGRERRLEAGETDTLLAHFADTNHLRLRCAFVLAIETAMRRGELVGLRWVDVDLQRRVVRLNDTKNGERRNVPLSSRARESLCELKLAAGLRATPESHVLGWQHPDVITWEFAKACSACGIHGLRWHDLRHEATSRLFERGLSLAEVAAVTGHKSWTMLRRYTHLRAEDLAGKLG